MNTQNFLWPLAAQLPPLAHGQVHVCSWDLDPPPLLPDWEILSEEESSRARRFVFPRDRDRYVRAHSTMRTVLAGYSGLPPAEISFLNNAYGKPEIEIEQNSRCIRFNLSHSAGIAILAVACGYELGIDVEVLRAIEPDVAEHHFSTRELATLRSLRQQESLQGFYRCWTSKEALLKGEGLGLNLALDAFDVEAHPQRAPALLSSRTPARFMHGWLLVEIKPTPHTVGTLAVRDETGCFRADAVRCFSLSR